MGKLAKATLRLGLGAWSCVCFDAQGALAQSPAPGAAPTEPVGEERHFDVLEYVVDGNTVLPTIAIEEAIYPFLGEGRSASDVDKAREALERAYITRGYQAVRVEIPQQPVDRGIIHFQVSESPVGRVRVVNSRYHSLERIKETAPSVAEGRVIDSGAMQKDIVELNQQPDLKVTPRLKPGSAPDTVDVDLEVEDKLPLHATLELNNQHNQDTTALRAVASVSYDNLWQLGHSLNVSYRVAPERPDDGQVISATYIAHVPRSPVTLLGYGVKSDSDVSALANTTIVGKGTIFGLRTIVNLPSGEGFYHSFTAGVDRKNLTQNVLTGDVESKSPVLYYPVSLAYAATIEDKDGSTQLDASVNFAIPGVSDDSAFLDSQRFDSTSQFFYFKGGLNRTQLAPFGTTAFGKIEAQLTNDPLLSSEQFSVGGAQSVRGYLEAERLGDYGVLASAELRSPSFASEISRRINEWRVIAFLEGAKVWRTHALPEEQFSFGLAGIGLGTRITAFDVVNAALDLAFPLVDGAVTKAGTPRAHLRLWSEF